MSTNTTTTENRSDASPDVHVHIGLTLRPAELDDLPEDVRTIVDAHLDHAASNGAYQIEVRDYGEGTFEVIHRHSPDGETIDG